MPYTTSRSLRRIFPYAFFLVLVLIFLWRPVFTGRALLPGDYLAQMAPWNSVIEASPDAPQWNPLQWDAIAQFYPWRVFYARSMGAGHIPLWNPHQFCGTPFLANGQSAVLYPGNLLFLVFDPITAFTVFAALHLFLAAAFTYWLLRELGAGELGGIVAGITFALSAFMVRWLELPTFIGAAVWLPLALLLIHRAAERRSVFYGMLSGLVIALAFLAGHLQIAFYVLFAAVLWWLWKLAQVWREQRNVHAALRVALPFAGCVLILGLISAAQILPSIELSSNSHRAGSPTAEGYEWFAGNSLKAYHLVTAFIPDFYGSPVRNDFMLLGRFPDDTRHVASAADYMEYGLYAGVLPLMLASVGSSLLRRRNVGFFAFLAALSLLIALGTPINRLFYYLVPGFSSLGGPNRILMLYFLGVAGLAAYGADWSVAHAADLGQWRDRMRGAASRAMWPVAVFALVAISCDLIARGFLQSFANSGPQGPFMLTAGRFVVFFVAGALLMLLRSGGRISRGMFGVLAVALVCADLFAAGVDYNPTCDRAKVYPRTKLTAELQRLTRNGERIAAINPHWSLWETPKAILPPNAAMVYGLYDVQGYDSLFTRSYKDWSSKMQGADSSPPENGNMVLVRRADQLSSDYSDLVRYTVSRESMIGLDSPIFERVSRIDGVCLFVDTRAGGLCSVGEGGHQSAIPTELLGPNAIRMSTPDSSASFHFFCTGTGYPGWYVWGEGNTARSYTQGRIKVTAPGARPTNLSDAGALLMEGPAVVYFEFRPFSFRLGLFLMLVGVSVICCAGVCCRGRGGKAGR